MNKGIKSTRYSRRRRIWIWVRVVQVDKHQVDKQQVDKLNKSKMDIKQKQSHLVQIFMYVTMRLCRQFVCSDQVRATRLGLGQELLVP